jgi:hypothetical protein
VKANTVSVVPSGGVTAPLLSSLAALAVIGIAKLATSIAKTKADELIGKRMKAI